MPSRRDAPIATLPRATDTSPSSRRAAPTRSANVPQSANPSPRAVPSPRAAPSLLAALLEAQRSRVAAPDLGAPTLNLLAPTPILLAPTLALIPILLTALAHHAALMIPTHHAGPDVLLVVVNYKISRFQILE